MGGGTVGTYLAREISYSDEKIAVGTPGALVLSMRLKGRIIRIRTIHGWDVV